MADHNIDFFNKIAKISLDHFNHLPKTGKPLQNEWTVLSCIVKENLKDESLEVVALGTGSKCIGKNKMSPEGDILNDSHAEVICRRSFLRYLYEEAVLSIRKSSNIFNFNEEFRKLCLEYNIKFHFFTTHVPCGDATIFHKQNLEDFGNALIQPKNYSKENCYVKESMQEETAVETFSEDNEKVSLKRRNCSLEEEKREIKRTKDIFRTGAKCLPGNPEQDKFEEGVSYHITGVVRTKPGRGDPTLSVSCSDKLAKWCYLGIQGALLNILIDIPIYLETFTIAGGTAFCKNALERALYNRFKAFDLKLPYHKHEMVIGQAELGFSYRKDSEKIACASSIAWSRVAFKPLEVAVDGRKQGVTKKNLATKAGRLKICKKELFDSFKAVVDLAASNTININFETATYKNIKENAVLYQEMCTILKNEGFSVWTIKDLNLLNFCL